MGGAPDHFSRRLNQTDTPSEAAWQRIQIKLTDRSRATTAGTC